MQEHTIRYSLKDLPSSRGVETIVKMLLLDGATHPQDVMNNKPWADLFVELQK